MNFFLLVWLHSSQKESDWGRQIRAQCSQCWPRHNRGGHWEGLVLRWPHHHWNRSGLDHFSWKHHRRRSQDPGLLSSKFLGLEPVAWPWTVNCCEFKEEVIALTHVESRLSTLKSEFKYEIFVELKCTPDKLVKFLDKLKKLNVAINILSGPLPEIANPSVNKKDCVWIPLSIWDLDNCTHLNIKYEPDIDSRHPVRLMFCF